MDRQTDRQTDRWTERRSFAILEWKGLASFIIALTRKYQKLKSDKKLAPKPRCNCASATLFLVTFDFFSDQNETNISSNI